MRVAQDTNALLRLAQAMVSVSVRATEQISESVSPTQLRVLTLLQDAPSTNLGSLAEALGSAPSSASRLVDRLVAAGLIDRRLSNRTRREIELRLTGAGRGVLEQVNAARLRELAALLRAVPEASRAAVVRAADVLSEAAGRSAAVTPAVTGPDDASASDAHSVDADAAVGVLLRALEQARPSAAIDVFLEELRRNGGVSTAALWLADYRLAELVPVDGRPSVPVGKGALGRAFRTQRPVRVNERWYVPLSARRERLGVLVVSPTVVPSGARQAAVDSWLAGIEARSRAFAFALEEAVRGTDVLQLARRTQRLTVTAEMQWQLLPGRALGDDRFQLAGQLEPAYRLGSDAFDWAADEDELHVAVVDARGRRGAGPLTAALALGALRNARRAGLPLAEVVSLADQALHDEFRGRAWVEALLLWVTWGESPTVQAVSTGSLRLWRQRGVEAGPIELDGQLGLGMFDGTHYLPEAVAARVGDRLLIFSAGLLHPSVGWGAGELARLLAELRTETANEVVRRVTERVSSRGGHAEDATVVCLDLLSAASGQ